jgi:hypothetical protein
MYKKPKWNIKRYAPNWLEQSLQCRINAHNTCEVCGIVRGTELVSKRTGNIYKAFLSACHLNQFDELNMQAELVCMCLSCHAAYDSAYHNAQKAIKHRAIQLSMLLFTDKSYAELETEYKIKMQSRKVTRSDFFTSPFYLSRQGKKAA